MKLFSNFDTHLLRELHSSSAEKYGSDNVLIVRRDPIYLRFKIVIPSLVRVITLTIALWIKNKYFGALDYEIGVGISIIAIIFTMAGIWKKLLKLIDYFMDFCIITPVQILSYDQCGLLNRSSRSLDLNNLKSIDIEKNGLSKSIFDYGTLIFFSEGDSMNSKDTTNIGTIRLNYIKHPTAVISRIMDVVKHSQTPLREIT